MLEILMATMHRNKISDLNLEKKNITSKILIINQTSFNETQIEENKKMISYKGIGSSNSRNYAIEEASGEICLIADDDIVYLKEYEKIVLSAFEKNPNADIITFQIQCPDGTMFKSNYSKNEYWHNKRTILKCSSIEIAFKRKSIIDNNLKFDTEFGLGSKYRVHDEVIFLMDALNRGLKLKYIPTPIVIHPKESSGTNYIDHLIISKGAAFVRLFGNKACFYNIAFAVKKYKEYKMKYTFSKFLKLIFKGSMEYKQSHKI